MSVPMTVKPFVRTFAIDQLILSLVNNFGTTETLCLLRRRPELYADASFTELISVWITVIVSKVPGMWLSCCRMSQDRGQPDNHFSFLKSGSRFSLNAAIASRLAGPPANVAKTGISRALAPLTFVIRASLNNCLVAINEATG